MWASLLPWLLCLLLPLPSDCQTMTSSSPPSDTSPFSTLLFHGGSLGSGLRNCSCSVPVRDCDEALANTRCRCHSVLRTSLQRLRQEGILTVWVKEPWVLEEVLNISTVEHLRLSFCGPDRLQNQQLVLLGLQTLRIHSSAPGAPHPTQEVQVLPSAGPAAELHITLVDLSVLNGLSVLKAYSVIGPPPQTLAQFLPHLVFSQPSPADGPFTDRVPPGPAAALGSLPAPVNLKVKSVNFHHVLHWDPGPASPPGTHYMIFQRIGRKMKRLPNSTSETSLKLKLEPLKEYSFAVRALYNHTESSMSSRITFAPFRDSTSAGPQPGLGQAR
ncbi:uncharacterized protein LOC119419784 [Nematolebias whitei]|uniref:uncharacterized protein LOC119419784 n=1 Tax=Nematolebias whitei TaxID=451745 RepID=UPI00189AE8D7|nr:uncharacterized protein LOC119419784 [Nematolebias whitei]